MSNLLKPNASNPVEGLATWVYAVETTGPWTCNIKSTLPYNSGLGIFIHSNSVELIAEGFAATNPTPTQTSMGAGTTAYFTAGDTVSVILSSTAAADMQPNAVKSVIDLFFGPL